MIVSIASGKGGTGKTTIASSLALALSERGEVQALDCDVEEPNLHLFLDPQIRSVQEVNILVPEVDKKKCTLCGKCASLCAYHALVVVPQSVLVLKDLCHSCGGCAFFCPEGAISEVPQAIGKVVEGWAGGISFARGELEVGKALAPPVIKAVKSRMGNSAVVIDAPPGTSCPAVAAIAGSDFCLLVTEPTPFGLNDLSLAVDTVREMGVPLGVVINKDGMGSTCIDSFCCREGIEILMRIPFERRIAESCAWGRPLIRTSLSLASGFARLWREVERRLDP